MEKKPVIIDTDLTVDDAVAIAMAARNDVFDIKAITPSGAETESTKITIEKLYKLYTMNCRTGQGSLNPLFDAGFDKHNVYGDKAEYEPFLPCCDSTCNEYAWDIIKDEAVKAGGEMEIIAMGPLTNIAIALLTYPEIKSLIKRIVCVAGSGYVGNVLPYSEYNAYSDPYALKVTFESGVPVVMYGLDGAQNCSLTQQDIKGFKPHNEFEARLADICLKKAENSENGTVTLNSAVAMAYMKDETLAVVQDYYVEVETHSIENKGWTVVDRLGKYKKQPNIKVVTESDKSKFMQILSEK